MLPTGNMGADSWELWKGGGPGQSPGNKKAFGFFIYGAWAGCRKGRAVGAPGCLGVGWSGVDGEHSPLVWDCSCDLSSWGQVATQRG